MIKMVIKYMIVNEIMYSAVTSVFVFNPVTLCRKNVFNSKDLDRKKFSICNKQHTS